MLNSTNKTDTCNWDKTFQHAEDMIEAMPPWQREYADEVISSALNTDKPTKLPVMFGGPNQEYT